MLERARADGGSIKLTIPMSQEVAMLWNQEVENPYQHVGAIYFSLSAPALSGVLDRVRTTIVELVAEMRAGTPTDAEAPSGAVADHAVDVVVHGRSARINVTSASASGDGARTVLATPSPPEHSRWRRVGAFVVGIATVVAAVVALAQWQGWF